MLATFVIGLREGLEAALIVGIIAAFLRNNGKSLVAMWVGVVLAVLLSIAVGVGLDLIEQALPQADQEGMEAVIGAVAIVFVTGMIAWMNTHARDMKRQLEAEAAEALGQASTYALASMAFLAVLKEGFETSVFLLATFSAAQSAALAAAGAIVGLLAAVAIGWGIYVGGVKINLSRFFRFTGGFLILVAAGLVVTALRTGHEAGWLNAGQQATVNLSWLVAPGTVQSALITGVLGIPADPRLIEVIGWFAYLVPVALFVFWPHRWRPQPGMAARLQFAAAAVLAIVALGLATLYPAPSPAVPAQAPIVAEGGSAHAIGTAHVKMASGGLPKALSLSFGQSEDRSVSLAEAKRLTENHDGVAASNWTIAGTDTPPDAPSSLTLDRIIELSGGRIPVGLNPQRNPGPFTADWSTHRSIRVWTVGDVLLDARGHGVTIVRLSDGGLHTPRTLTVGGSQDSAPPEDWHVSAAYRDRVLAALNDMEAARSEHLFWAIQLPIALLFAALLLVALAARRLVRLRRSSDAAGTESGSCGDNHTDGSQWKGVTHVAQ